MARIRTIKPEFFKHYELYQLEKEIKLPLRIAFAGLWCVADREGRFKWKPHEIKTDVLPHDDCDFDAILNALHAHGFLRKFTHSAKDYGEIPNFLTHQVINHRESKSLLPSSQDQDSQVLDACPTRADASSTRPGHDQGEGKGRGREREGKGREDANTRALFSENSRFEIFWTQYPKKRDKLKTLRIWSSKKLDQHFDEIIEALQIEKKTSSWCKNAGEFIPYPTTWLNNDRWETAKELVEVVDERKAMIDRFVKGVANV